MLVQKKNADKPTLMFPNNLCFVLFKQILGIKCMHYIILISLKEKKAEVCAFH